MDTQAPAYACRHLKALTSIHQLSWANLTLPSDLAKPPAVFAQFSAMSMIASPTFQHGRQSTLSARFEHIVDTMLSARVTSEHPVGFRLQHHNVSSRCRDRAVSRTPSCSAGEWNEQWRLPVGMFRYRPGDKRGVPSARQLIGRGTVRGSCTDSVSRGRSEYGWQKGSGYVVQLEPAQVPVQLVRYVEGRMLRYCRREHEQLAGLCTAVHVHRSSVEVGRGEREHSGRQQRERNQQDARE